MSKALKSDLLLLLAAFVWGTAFVAQREGMKYIGPFTYNAIRFAMGGFVLLPMILKKRASKTAQPVNRHFWFSGLIAGLLLFGGTSFQQVGLQYTTAGKAGFITGLYVVLVPFVSLFLGQRYRKSVWYAAVLSLVGMALLGLDPQEELLFSKGDMLILICAIFWALHVLSIEKLVGGCEPVYLACCQFLICAFLSLILALKFEEQSWSAIKDAAIPLAYGGLMSVGLGFTLQVFAQKNAPAAHVAIIMSLEAVFAVVAGWLILDESMGLRAIAGCVLMLVGMILVQLEAIKSRKE